MTSNTYELETYIQSILGEAKECEDIEKLIINLDVCVFNLKKRMKELKKPIYIVRGHYVMKDGDSIERTKIDTPIKVMAYKTFREMVKGKEYDKVDIDYCVEIDEIRNQCGNIIESWEDETKQESESEEESEDEEEEKYEKETITYDDISFTIQELDYTFETKARVFDIGYEDDILDDDVNPELGQKINLMWIKTIREKMNWKEGEKLYIFTKQNSDDNFRVFCSKEKEDVSFVSKIIDPKGYVLSRYYNQYIRDEDKDDEIYNSFLIRSESVYNDMRCDELKK
jgi:hypothetical protein